MKTAAATQKAATQKPATPKFQTPHEKKVAAVTAPPEKKPKAANKMKPAAKNGAPRKGKLGSLLGHSVISVLRAMGKAGWDFEQAKAAMDRAKIPAATHTVRMALKRGRDGEKKIAPLSAKELATLKA